MSWGYWGIVAGLLALLTIFFVSLDLVYSGAKTIRQAPRGTTDEPVEAAKQPSRQAA